MAIPTIHKINSTNKTQDLSGLRFGRLTVVCKSIKINYKQKYECLCDCGKQVIVESYNLRNGHTQSCGCLNREILKKNRIVDHTGKTFNKLTVVELVDQGSPQRYRCVCTCGSETIVTGYNLLTGGVKSCGCARSDVTGDKCSQWKGGVTKRGTVSFDAPIVKTLVPMEKIRKNPDQINELQVRCAHCKTWFTPSREQVAARAHALGSIFSENRFYCSDRCKELCPVFRRIRFPKNFIPESARRKIGVSRVVIDMVLERDKYTCQKCGSLENLEVHHILGVRRNPILANDTENCLTLCKQCHKMIHSYDGCTHNDLKCK